MRFSLLRRSVSPRGDDLFFNPTFMNEFSKRGGEEPSFSENKNSHASSSDNELTLTPEQETARIAAISHLSNNKYDLALRVKQRANLPMSIFETREARNILRTGIIYNVANGFPWVVEEIRDNFPMPEQEFLDAVRVGLLDALKEGLFEETIRTLSDLGLPNSLLRSDAMRDAATEGIKRNRANARSVASWLEETFGIHP